MHTLSIQTGPLSPVERQAIVEEFWASRNAWAEAMNADRRLAWERKWAGLSERDLPPCHTRQIGTVAPESGESRVLPMRRRKDELPGPDTAAKVPAYRFYCQKAPTSAENLSEAAS